jgi:methionyl-tRNA synthetase
MVERFGTDAFRFFLFREVPFGGDGDFSEHALIARINTDLANDLGNLASRSLKMAGRYSGGAVPGPGRTGGEEAAMRALAEGIPAAMDRELGILRFQHAIEECWKLVSYTNKYIDTNAPWQLAKDPALEGRLHTVLYHCLEALRVLAVCLRPFMPNAMTRLYAGLGAEGDVTAPGALGLAAWGGLVPGTKLTEMDALFPRVETKKQQEKLEEKPKKEKKKPMTEEKKDAAAPESDGLIKIDDFMKVELKTARILEAERVEKSDKLIRLQVDSGERRQIVAGIGKAYAPEDLVGKTVIVVANLKPARLMGNLSEGMLLAATAEDGRPIILAPEEPVPPGVRVK